MNSIRPFPKLFRFVVFFFMLQFSFAQIHFSILGSDETGNGSMENPFASIQYALDVVNENDTILVSAGNYVENVFSPDSTYKKGVQLQGKDKKSTIIDGSVMNYFST